MCQFEDCWDRKKSKIIHEHEIIANIKPEIGKIRPVVIVYPHKRSKLAIIIFRKKFHIYMVMGYMYNYQSVTSNPFAAFRLHF